MILGAHVSISGGVYNAVKNAEDLNCETFQIFTKNQNQWKEKTFTTAEIRRFKKDARESSQKKDLLAAHASYLINLCSPDKNKLAKSREAFEMEINRCTDLGLSYLVFHPGAHLGKGVEWAIETISDSLTQSISATPDSKVRLLLETTAGQGTNMGHDFSHLARILDRVDDQSRTGVCLDTCHVFSAGYDLRTEENYHSTFDEFEERIGMGRLYAFHLNDSKKPLDSRVDRHERIGTGELGDLPFKLLIRDSRFKKIPGYLEVPGGNEAFLFDLKKLKSFRG
jgi:deoxyribonuclease-4